MPLFQEIILTLILFEFYRIMMIRSSFSFLQNLIAIFGGIFIGQNAINASLIGPMSIIAAAICYVSGFAVTSNNQLITSFSIFRIFILLLSKSLGFIGFMCGSIIIVAYLSYIKVFDTLYLSPLIPFNFTNFKNWIMPRKD